MSTPSRFVHRKLLRAAVNPVPEEERMEQLIERGCGLDVHRDTVAACVRVPGPNRGPQQDVRTFGTTAAELLALRDWLEGHGVTHVAMESTGVYWKPVFYVLEDSFTCLLLRAGRRRDIGNQGGADALTGGRRLGAGDETAGS